MTDIRRTEAGPAVTPTSDAELVRRRSDFRQVEATMVTATIALRVATIAWRQGQVDGTVRALDAADRGIAGVLRQLGER